MQFVAAQHNTTTCTKSYTKCIFHGFWKKKWFRQDSNLDFIIVRSVSPALRCVIFQQVDDIPYFLNGHAPLSDTMFGILHYNDIFRSDELFLWCSFSDHVKFFNMRSNFVFFLENSKYNFFYFA